MGGTEEEVKSEEKGEKHKDEDKHEGKEKEEKPKKEKKKEKGEGEKKEKKKKEKNPEDKNDPSKLRAKLDKVETKIRDLMAKKDDILKLIEAAEKNPASSSEAAKEE